VAKKMKTEVLFSLFIIFRRSADDDRFRSDEFGKSVVSVEDVVSVYEIRIPNRHFEAWHP
jgi:hypothetical protein